MTSKENPVQSRSLGTSKRFERTGDESATVEKPKMPRVKRTFHVDEDVVFMLEEYQAKSYRDTRVKQDLSTIVTEAIRQMVEPRLSDAKAS